ncbi:MAG: hypothetical protein OEZ06_00775 [Myxococcales bacterium]|nr:hypothetical protein [Myxococcales bacterium]
MLARDGLQARYPRVTRRVLEGTDKSVEAEAVAAGDYTLVLVDEAHWHIAECHFFALAAVVVDDPPVTRASIDELAKVRSEDPFCGGRAKHFEKKGFHYG